VGKLLASAANQGIAELALELLGPHGMLKPGGYSMDRTDDVTAFIWQDPAESFLRTRANSIEGGTTEIMRNMIGEQILGLPPEPRVDKDVPWREVPRS
jgi:alkylation response protein AidB-like acyl-CoA dehydrogenase